MPSRPLNPCSYKLYCKHRKIYAFQTFAQFTTNCQYPTAQIVNLPFEHSSDKVIITYYIISELLYTIAIQGLLVLFSDHKYCNNKPVS